MYFIHTYKCLGQCQIGDIDMSICILIYLLVIFYLYCLIEGTPGITRPTSIYTRLYIYMPEIMKSNMFMDDAKIFSEEQDTSHTTIQQDLNELQVLGACTHPWYDHHWSMDTRLEGHAIP